MTDVLDGTRKEPYIEIPNKLIRSPEYIAWMYTSEYPIYMYLQSYIIRSPLKNTGLIDLYQDYFVDKGQLAARWRLGDIAKALNKKTRGAILKPIQSMVKKGYITVDKRKIGRNKLNIYVFGTHNGLGQETLYAHVVIAKIIGNNIVSSIYEASQLS